MYGQTFKLFAKWVRDNKLKLDNCDCGMYGNEHDVDCSLVLSEEVLFDKWRNEIDQKGEIAS
jgi:hypothetical protein